MFYVIPQCPIAISHSSMSLLDLPQEVQELIVKFVFGGCHLVVVLTERCEVHAVDEAQGWLDLRQCMGPKLI